MKLDPNVHFGANLADLQQAVDNNATLVKSTIVHERDKYKGRIMRIRSILMRSAKDATVKDKLSAIQGVVNGADE